MKNDSQRKYEQSLCHLRIEPGVHRLLKHHAEAAGVSLKALAEESIQQAAAEAAAKMLQERVARLEARRAE